MNALRSPVFARRVALPAKVTALGVVLGALAACAAPPAPGAPADQVAQPAQNPTHLCKPQETVGFSCKLHDQRLLSLCASPGFERFAGAPKDNPGYAYVALGSQEGRVAFTYPPQPASYKKHMTYRVSLSAWPHMFVDAGQGTFLQFSLDIEEPVYANDANAPSGWPLKGPKGRPLCAGKIQRDHLDAYMSHMIDDPDWVKTRGWGQ